MAVCYQQRVIVIIVTYMYSNAKQGFRLSHMVQQGPNTLITISYLYIKLVVNQKLNRSSEVGAVKLEDQLTLFGKVDLKTLFHI